MSKSKRSLQEQLHARKLSQPPKLIYRILGYLWKLLYFKKLNIHTEIKNDPRKHKGPYIVVSNHASRLDYIYTGAVLLPSV